MHDTANEHIRIDANHRADAPRAAIVRFISSIDTFLAALPNIRCLSASKRPTISSNAIVCSSARATQCLQQHRDAGFAGMGQA